jgi:hypothetical protein
MLASQISRVSGFFSKHGRKEKDWENLSINKNATKTSFRLHENRSIVELDSLYIKYQGLKVV